MSEAFRATLDESCPQATLQTHTADSAEAQAQQASAALTGGAAVIVIDPVDPGAISGAVTQARSEGASVIALGDTITGAVPDFQVAYDEPASGSLVGPVVIQVAVDAAESGDNATPVPSGAPIEQVVLVDGPAGDTTLADWTVKVKEGLGARATIVHEAAVTELNATEGKRVIEEAIASLGSGGFGAVITPSDAVAAGVIAGLVEAGVTPGDMSITGLGGSLPGVQAIVSGDQLLTTWSPDGPAASVAATLACGQATGAGAPTGLTTTPVDNGTGQVATVLLTPIVVTSDGSIQGTRSIETTIVSGQAFGPDTVASICTEDLAQACDDLGLVVPSPSPSASASASLAAGSPAVTSPAVSQAPTGSAGPSPAPSLAPEGSPAP
jgi:D-xylose transport system substrate-binding protein